MVLKYVPIGDRERQWMQDLSLNLKSSLECASEVDKKRNEFLESYHNWSDSSKEAIKAITEIRDETLSINHNNNYVSLGGAAGGITGSVMGIAGIVSAIPTAGLSLIVTGGIVAAGGTVVSMFSNRRRNAATRTLYESAVQILERSKKRTDLFNQKCECYCGAVERFKGNLVTTIGKDISLSLFHEALDYEQLQFSEAFIDSLHTKLMLPVWSLDFVENAPNDISSLAKEIQEMLTKLKEFIKNDPCMSRILLSIIRNLLTEHVRKTQLRNLQLNGVINALTVFQMGIATGPAASVFYLTINNFVKQMSVATQVGLVALNAMSVALGIIDIAKRFVNLEYGSQSDESKNITNAINNMEEIREKIRNEITNIFGVLE